jgi:YD repeat-containing protein
MRTAISPLLNGQNSPAKMFHPRSRKISWVLAALVVLSNEATPADLEVLPVEYSTIDENFVDYASASFQYKATTVSIGSSDRLFAHEAAFKGISGDASLGYIYNLLDAKYGGTIGVNGSSAAATAYCGSLSAYSANVGLSQFWFCLAGGVFSPIRQDGASLALLPGGIYQLTTKTGVQYTYAPFGSSGSGMLTEIREPSGVISTLTHTAATAGGVTRYRLNSVQRNDGFQLRYSYATNTLSTTSREWHRLTSVTAVNSAIDYCDPTTLTCAYTKSWPTSTYSMVTLGDGSIVVTIADQAGTTAKITATKYFGDSKYYVVGLKLPTSTSANNITYVYNTTSSGLRYLGSAQRGVGTWNYGPTFTVSGTFTYTHYAVQTPTGVTSGVTSIDQPTVHYISPLTTLGLLDGRSLRFDNVNAHNRMTRVTFPEGNYEEPAYDTRGNITSRVATAKSGSGLPPITLQSASYDSSCVYPAKCNKPNWIRDAMGNQTDIDWDTTHGGVLSVTGPAVDVNGSSVRPQTRSGYTARYAWYKNSSGSVVQATVPIYLLTSERYCRTTASSGGGCAIAADEVSIAYEYGPTSSANNLFLRGKAVSADGATRRTCFSYDSYGNKISETLPRAGLSSCP